MSFSRLLTCILILKSILLIHRMRLFVSCLISNLSHFYQSWCSSMVFNLEWIKLWINLEISCLHSSMARALTVVSDIGLNSIVGPTSTLQTGLFSVCNYLHYFNVIVSNKFRYILITLIMEI